MASITVALDMLPAVHHPEIMTETDSASTSCQWRAARAWLWLLLPAVCHFGFSWIGFNPTDDGWMQAVARRIADGEVPHRDFIFVRPALSALLQVPLVWWGGDYAIWLSRLWGWLSLGTVCWLWSGRVATGAPFLARFALYAAAVPLCAHNFPVMAWHSLDGMVFCSVAVVLAARRTPVSMAAAFGCVGLAALCRQNFAVFAPLLMLAIGGRLRDWFAAGFWSMLPSLLYVAMLAICGGATDFFQQLWSTSGAFRYVGLFRYIKDWWFVGAVPLGLMLGWLSQDPAGRSRSWTQILAIVILATAGGGVAAILWWRPWQFHEACFALFGLVLGLTLPVLWRGWHQDDRLTFVAGIALTWVTALSIGYNSPALMSGVLVLLVWRILHLLSPGEPAQITRKLLPVLLVLVPAAGLAFSHARQTLPYRDRPVTELHHDVGSVLRGGQGLRTNEWTFRTLAELRQLTDRFAVEHHRYAILTDCAAHWILSPQRNPLPCEWPQITELGYEPELFRRVFAAIHALPQDARLVVQKFLISDYNWRLAPVPPDLNYYFVQNWVRAHWRKVGETQFFEIYAPPVTPERP